MSLLLESGDVTSAAILTPYNGQLRLLRQMIRCVRTEYLSLSRPRCQQIGCNSSSWHAGTRGHCWQMLKLQQSMASRDVKPTWLSFQQCGAMTEVLSVSCRIHAVSMLPLPDHAGIHVDLIAQPICIMPLQCRQMNVDRVAGALSLSLLRGLLCTTLPGGLGCSGHVTLARSRLRSSNRLEAKPQATSKQSQACYSRNKTHVFDLNESMRLPLHQCGTTWTHRFLCSSHLCVAGSSSKSSSQWLRSRFRWFCEFSYLAGFSLWYWLVQGLC